MTQVADRFLYPYVAAFVCVFLCAYNFFSCSFSAVIPLTFETVIVLCVQCLDAIQVTYRFFKPHNCSFSFYISEVWQWFYMINAKGSSD